MRWRRLTKQRRVERGWLHGNYYWLDSSCRWNSDFRRISSKQLSLDLLAEISRARNRYSRIRRPEDKRCSMTVTLLLKGATTPYETERSQYFSLGIVIFCRLQEKRPRRITINRVQDRTCQHRMDHSYDPRQRAARASAEYIRIDQRIEYVNQE